MKMQLYFIRNVSILLRPSSVNNINEKNKFACEKENNNRLNNLDISIIRNYNRSLSTKWFTKELKSNRMVNFKCNHPSYTIINTASNMISRALKVTDTEYINEVKYKKKF